MKPKPKILGKVKVQICPMGGYSDSMTLYKTSRRPVPTVMDAVYNYAHIKQAADSFTTSLNEHIGRILFGKVYVWRGQKRIPLDFKLVEGDRIILEPHIYSD